MFEPITELAKRFLPLALCGTLEGSLRLATQPRAILPIIEIIACVASVVAFSYRKANILSYILLDPTGTKACDTAADLMMILLIWTATCIANICCVSVQDSHTCSVYEHTAVRRQHAHSWASALVLGSKRRP